ncbi:MAG: exodeoxyribonuclease VII small subunit [Dehalococcoidia bacterium]|nr:exodeoxyribonuclease VII small subunit [Dehalococcoidia bacterium]MDW8009460.1 exodeoxyribonuclease VII small subunit [Chloroflexota bacterium]
MASEGDASFEALYRRLEEVVQRLEQGGLDLEESIALYEEGMRLAVRCRQMLEQAQLRITRLRDELGLYTGEGMGEPRPAYEAGEAETDLEMG